MANGTREVTIDIRAKPERVWQAMTDPTLTREYFYGTDILSDWKAGSRWTSESDGNVSLDGKILEIDPPRRLVQTFHVRDDDPAASEDASTVTWELTPLPNGGGTRLDLVHADQGEATMAYTDGGWEYILKGMKDLLEGE
jgi:uncharacterized protein YndB with AHSA1/START domain